MENQTRLIGNQKRTSEYRGMANAVRADDAACDKSGPESCAGSDDSWVKINTEAWER